MSIPSGPETFAVGQVLITGDVFYLGIDPEERRSYDLEETLALRLFAWTTDGQLWRDEWRKIGDRPVPSTYPQLDYRVVSGGEMMVQSFDRSSMRPFDPDRDDHIPYRSSQSSPLVEDAVKAFNGRGEWLPPYDKMAAR